MGGHRKHPGFTMLQANFHFRERSQNRVLQKYLKNIRGYTANSKDGRPQQT
jgi:hypothetical protein